MPKEQVQILPGMGQSQRTAESSGSSLFDHYQFSPAHYDEFFQTTQQPRETVKPFIQRIDKIGAEGLAKAWRRGDDLLRENGISYNLLGDDEDAHRPWNLDPIPLLLPEEEWNPLAHALVQRAHLWDSVLKDCYGPKNLLNEGLIPPALLYSQENFNRALPPLNPGTPFLTSYAVDAARSPGGSWTVIADRTEAPNGMGYALENRIVLTHVFPETSNQVPLVRLASFFQNLRTSLFAQAHSAVDDPGVVMLSPGPADRTYFEDAYLARYLGIPLAVGEELTVRNDRLFLKTVSGLRRVHVLYRRVHETLIDPLENPSDSRLGVPGITQAIRAGTVSVINPPGTGLAESPAFLPYLPAIAQRLLGQDLLIPSIETIWGGQNPQLLDAMPGMTSLFKDAFGRRLSPPVPTVDLQGQPLADIRLKLETDPSSLVLQRQMEFSSAPVWNKDALESRHLALRFFLFSDGISYQIMPGALVRCANSPGELPGLSLSHEAGSKDLWVIASKGDALQVQSNLPAYQPIRRSTGPLSSRSADNLFWIGRYSERTEFATRIILEIAARLTGANDAASIRPIKPLLETLAHFNYLTGDQDHEGVAHPRATIRRKLLPIFFAHSEAENGQQLNSIPKTLDRLRDLASLSRDRLSGESWLIIQSLHEVVRSSPTYGLSTMRPILQKALTLQSAFNGTCRENLTRNQGWLFLSLGRKLERASWLVSLVSRVLDMRAERLTSDLLDAVLAVNDTTLTYRFRYHGAPQTLPALDLILFDPANPRSLIYQLAELDRDLTLLPTEEGDGLPRSVHRFVQRAHHYLQTELLDADNPETEAEQLHKLAAYIKNLEEELPGFTEQLGWEFFTHADPTNT
ncbi:MAG: circularly permuted type 2 ATP-grasp protein [Verrucomicrobiota bacterium]